MCPFPVLSLSFVCHRIPQCTSWSCEPGLLSARQRELLLPENLLRLANLRAPKLGGDHGCLRSMCPQLYRSPRHAVPQAFAPQAYKPQANQPVVFLPARDTCRLLIFPFLAKVSCAYSTTLQWAAAVRECIYEKFSRPRPFSFFHHDPAGFRISDVGVWS